MSLSARVRTKKMGEAAAHVPPPHPPTYPNLPLIFTIRAPHVPSVLAKFPRNAENNRAPLFNSYFASFFGRLCVCVCGTTGF